MFNDAVFTVTAVDDFTPPTSPFTGVPFASRDVRYEQHCIAGEVAWQTVRKKNRIQIEVSHVVVSGTQEKRIPIRDSPRCGHC